MFERTTTCQHVAVSNILSSPTEVNLPQSTVHGSLLMQVLTCHTLKKNCKTLKYNFMNIKNLCDTKNNRSV